MSEVILMNCYFFPPGAAENKRGGGFFIPRYSTTNPEFANSKRLPKVSSLVREQQRGTYETIVAKGRMFLSLLLLTFHIFSIHDFI